MGTVYQGSHVVIGKPVAVKFLHDEFAGSEEVVKRFYREAQASAAIGHDSIIDVMDVGISGEGEPYLVMEYLEGENLAATLLRTGPLPLSAACGIMEPVLQALGAAHEIDIIHRDLKPDNIFIVQRKGAPPRIKLIDFGISKFTQGGTGEKLTQTGAVMGTPAYMAPEQARGTAELDQRADIFSMGVIFYEMLTGKLPFEGSSFTEIVVSILTADPIPPEKAFSGFPPAAGPLLQRALAKDPAARYQSCDEFIAGLRTLSGFESRREHLTSVAAGIKHTTFAVGNLGAQPPAGDSGTVAADVLDQVAAGQTATRWAGTRAKQRTRNPILIALGVSLLVAAVAAGAVLFALRGTGSKPDSLGPREVYSSRHGAGDHLSGAPSSSPDNSGGSQSNVSPGSSPATTSPSVRLVNDRIAQVSASTSRKRHPPEHAIDGKRETAWNHVGTVEPEGQWLAVDFESPMTITRIWMTTGWDHTTKKGVDLFTANSHLVRFRIVFSDSNKLKETVPTGERFVDIEGLNATTQRVVLLFDEVTLGTKWKDIVISNIRFFGYPAAESRGDPKSRPTPSDSPEAEQIKAQMRELLSKIEQARQSPEGADPADVEAAVSDPASPPSVEGDVSTYAIPELPRNNRKARVHLNNGRVHGSEGEHEIAIGEYLLAIARNPDLAWTWGEMSYSYNKLGRYGDALAAAQQAVELGGEPKMLGAVYYNIGTAQQKLGNEAEAIEAYETSLELRPGHKTVIRRLKALRGE